MGLKRINHEVEILYELANFVFHVRAEKLLKSRFDFLEDERYVMLIGPNTNALLLDFKNLI